MELSFFTRDYRLDYPNIGWIPRLTSVNNCGAYATLNIQDILVGLTQYCSGCYPELVLIGQAGRWTCYLTALDSGRRDFMDRIIRVSLLIQSDERDSQADRECVCRFLQKYIEIIASGCNSVTLIKDVLTDYIQEGEPKNWCEQDVVQQKEVANGLLSRILDHFSTANIETSRVEGQMNNMPAFWYAGAASSQKSFCQLCGRILLENEATSPTRVALSLSYLGQKYLSNAEVSCGLWKQVGSPESAAVLLSNNSDLSYPVTAFTPLVKREESCCHKRYKCLTRISWGLTFFVSVFAFVQNSWYQQAKLENNHLSVQSVEQKQNNSQLRKDIQLLNNKLEVLTLEKQKLIEELKTHKPLVQPSNDASTLGNRLPQND